MAPSHAPVIITTYLTGAGLAMADGNATLASVAQLLPRLLHG